jgi:WD40 repeat protein
MLGWDTRAWKAARRLRIEQSEIRSIAFSPDGQRLAFASDETAKLWKPRRRGEVIAAA